MANKKEYKLLFELLASDAETCSTEVLIERIGSLVDLASDFNRPDGTSKALEWCDLAESKKPPLNQQLLLDYFYANAWDNRYWEKRTARDDVWNWEQPELERQIYYLRHAASMPEFKDWDTYRHAKCSQI